MGILDAPDMHEVLLTRGDFPKSLQHLIWDKCNCTLVHQNCHISAGSHENQLKLIVSLIHFEGYEAIEKWLNNVNAYVKGNQVQHALYLLEEARRISNEPTRITVRET